MRKTFVVCVALVMLVVAAAPAGAKKPDNPGKPGAGPTNPPTCMVTDAFHEETLMPAGAGEYSEFFIEVSQGTLDGRPLSTTHICVEVTVISGRMNDLNVALVDYAAQAARRCGFYWPGGKLGQGDSFAAAFSLAGYEGQPGFCGSDPEVDVNGGALAVGIIPRLSPKADSGVLEVRLGFVS